MKYLPLLILILLASCRLTTENEGITTEMVISSGDNGEVSEITFKETLFKFGEISQGEKVDFVFEFENTGDIPLIIASVKAGCTLTEDWPREPISPGEGGKIPVQFNSDGLKGHMSKSITLVANTKPKTSILYFEGTVIAPESN
jgi:hypothetical protein